ncbi:MAG: 7-cyano-7-deazaguanine synthase, partial [Rickettsiales bacterium]|nr:7-cyano-7-deazaguanine synthase [Rickettsiales bacterium]
MSSQSPQKNAIVLLSGGLDSATVVAIAKDKGYALHALSFEYGQRHKIEIESSEKICEDFGIKEHKVITIDLTTFGHSALTDQSIDVPENQPTFRETNDIPITYVPARNTIFLSYALAFAEVRKAEDIFIGVNAVDYS